MSNKEIQTTKYVAITAAMSAAAMSQAIDWKEVFEKRCCEQYGWGVVETYAELGEIAYVSAELLEDLNKANINHPGVYAYEVDEEVGKEFQRLVMKGTYAKAEALLTLGSYAAEFFVCTENQEDVLPIIAKHTKYVP